MPLELRDLRALEGPNIYYPQPAVKLQVWADRDIRTTISNTVKQWAQALGVVIGALRQEVQSSGDGMVITTTWTTPLPNVGERMAEGVFADLQAAEQHDDEYSHDDLLFAAINQRKREEPSLAQLQLYAEARVRDLPMYPRGDGTVMIGSGARGWSFEPGMMSLGMKVDVPWDQIGTIPIVAVTGTNGKTTTARLIAHILASTGKRVGRTDTDGITIGEQLVESGDWAGWGGARRVLTDSTVDVAVLETSRGGILRRGLGFSTCDVSVVTNVSNDHLGEFGIDTPDQMAQVKGVIVLATQPDGHVVLNADDPLVLGLRSWAAAPVVLFSRNPHNTAIVEHAAQGGATIVVDGDAISVSLGDQHGRMPLAEVPITFGGAAEHNVSNVLAAIGACLSLGVDLQAIQAALRDFLPDAAHNANRLNVYTRDGMTVVLDYAHNEAGTAALVRFGQSLQRERGGRLLVVIGGPGDRTDDQIQTQGALAGAAADALFVHEETRYLRGRAPGETSALYQRGAETAGLLSDRISLLPDEVSALDAVLAQLQPGDVALVAAHAQRDDMLTRLTQWSAAQPS